MAHWALKINNVLSITMHNLYMYNQTDPNCFTVFPSYNFLYNNKNIIKKYVRMT